MEKIFLKLINSSTKCPSLDIQVQKNARNQKDEIYLEKIWIFVIYNV